MRKSIAAVAGGALTLGLVAATAPSAAAAAAACSTDATAPTVTAVSVAKSYVVGVNGGTGFVNIAATDDCGVATTDAAGDLGVDAVVQRSATPDQHFEFGSSARLLSGTAQNGVWQVTIPFDPSDLPGSWTVPAVRVVDKATPEHETIETAKAGQAFTLKAQGRASMGLSATAVRKGSPVTITAGVAYAWNGAYRAGAGLPVRAEVRLAGSTNWISLGTKTTDSRGLATFSHKPYANVEYRVFYAGTSTVTASSTKPRLVTAS